jgi:hypothetical protein
VEDRERRGIVLVAGCQGGDHGDAYHDRPRNIRGTLKRLAGVTLDPVQLLFQLVA